MLENRNSDQVDHDRTTHQRAGAAMKDGANSVGIMAIAAIAMGIIALIT